MNSSQEKARIAILSERVKNQIAAGEVIERPASVVKELVENAIDAGATRIVVELEEGGTRLVRVVDDGGGMSREDLALAFAPHATSKLFETDDLEHIASLGFRGEALASIGAIARCRIVTRERRTRDAFAVENDGGAVGPVVEAGGAEGTLIEVRDLFFNVPARRRFLKRTSTELARCLDVLQRIALAQPGVGIVALHDGARLYDVEPSMDLRARIRRTFGADLAANLAAVDAHVGLSASASGARGSAALSAGGASSSAASVAGPGRIELTGFVAPPRFARGDTARQMWFLNGRPLRDKVLLRALKDGYRGFLFDNRQPVAFLALALDPARVDVNVHPAKAEVRFRDERIVFGFIVDAVRRAVATTDIATPGTQLIETALRREAREESTRSFFAGGVRSDPAATILREVPEQVVANRERAGSQPARAEQDDHPARDLDASSSAAHGAREVASGLHVGDLPSGASRTQVPSAARDDETSASGPFLQIANTYLVRALAGGFEIIDQHALHERITFEGLLADLRAGRTETQHWLVPELVEASRAEVALVADHVDALQRIGIELALFGPTTIAVHGLPTRLARPDPQGIVRDVIGVLESARTPRVEEVLEAVLHRAACRSSVMAGDPLAPEEIRALIERGRALESDQTCVHGRPTRVRFTLADLERAFARR